MASPVRARRAEILPKARWRREAPQTPSGAPCGAACEPCDHRAVTDRYLQPGWFTKNVFNRIVAGTTRMGVSVLGSRVLEVRGRTSGEPRQVPVNLLTVGDQRYLVAPRGETQWVRNLRASGGEATLVLGRRREEVAATELADEEKPPLLRAYLKRWKAEIGMFFKGVGPDSSDEELLRIAPGYPVFRLRDR